MRRGLLARLGLVLLGLLGGLVGVEAVLQLGAAYVAANTTAQAPRWHGDRLRVLCVGDSNVYGLWVERSETFPHHLQRLWRVAAPDSHVEVLNLGFPGLNSSKLRRNFHLLMDALRPTLVLVLVGSNDITSAAVPIDETVPVPLSYRLWQHSRVYRLLYMLVTGLREGDVDVDVRYRADEERRGVVRTAGVELDLAGTDRTRDRDREWHLALQKNLRAMAADAAAVGAEFLLLTYPSHQSMYGSTNIQLAGASLPVIDLAAAFSDACPSGNCRDLFQADQHPTARGNALMAQVVFDGLVERGLVAIPGDGTR